MTNFWPLAFGLIGFWFVIGIVELIRSPKSPHISGTGHAEHPLPN